MNIVGLGIVLIAAAMPADGTTMTARILGEPRSYARAAADLSTQLSVTAHCSKERPRAADINLGWSTTRAGITALRVDITAVRDGFAMGKFVTSGELAPGARTFEFPDGRPGVYYYWRLLTKTEEGWVYAANGRFDAPICPWDGDEEEKE
jgi:hypothetical protein